MVTAVFGVIANSVLNLYNFHLLFSLGTMGFMIALTATEHNQVNEKKRLAYMFSLCFLVGCSTGIFLNILNHF